jgi:DNA polymerase-3 subunit alpha
MTTEDFLWSRSRKRAGRASGIPFPDEAVVKETPEYDERLDIELQVINQMGFPGYFLIVMEFIQWSKDNGVPVGPGVVPVRVRWWPMR